MSIDLEAIKARLGVIPRQTILIHAQPRQQPDWRAAYNEASRDRAILLSEVERLTLDVGACRQLLQDLHGCDVGATMYERIEALLGTLPVNP